MQKQKKDETTMMAVKHIHLSGEENVYLTKRINFVPGRAKGTTADGPAPVDTVWIEYDDDGRTHELHGGTIFVMNDSGATVARYDLGVSMVPQGHMVGSAMAGPRVAA